MGIVSSSMKEICRIFLWQRGLIVNNLRKKIMAKAEVGSINLKNAGLGTANAGLKMFNDSSLEADFVNSTSFKQDDLEVSSASDIMKDGGKDAAAIKVQKVYRSYRTRRNFADWALLSDELWWHTIDSLRLKESLFYDTSKPETAISRWSRGRLRAAKVGKGLSKDENARELAIQHWLEAIDPRHRYGRNLHKYYNEWVKRDTVQPFFHWLDIGDGRDLNLQDKCPRSTLKKELIKYLGPKEREHYEVIPQNGKLIYKQSGQLIDTTQGSDITEGSGGSPWIFVMSTSKKLYIGKKLRGTFQHSSFLAGGATSAAGKLTVQDGVLKTISPYSGHYHPTEQNLSELLNFLKENGVDIADVQTGAFSDEERSISVTKHESKEKENQPIETLDSNIALETQGNTMDMDKNNIGVANAETEREENQPPDTLKTNLHQAHTESNSQDEDKSNNIAPFRDEEQNGSEVKTGMYSLLSQVGSTKGTERTETEGGKGNQDPVHYKRSLSGELEIQRLEIPPTKLLQRINSKKAIQSYQLGKQLSFKWSSGVGPRIGCVADYPPELRVKALELVTTPRGTSTSSFESAKTISPSGDPSPRCKSPSGNITPTGKPHSGNLTPTGKPSSNYGRDQDSDDTKQLTSSMD